MRTVTSTKLHKSGALPGKCTINWWFLIVYKFYRMCFITFYYYLTPFLILVFQAILLYSKEIYTQYKAEKAAEEAAAAAAEGTLRF